MKLTKEEVAKIAKLARLGLCEVELEKFGIQLSGILTYVAQLNEIDTQGIEPKAQVTDLLTVMRNDECAREPLASPDELLACSPLYDERIHQIKVPSVF